MSHYRPATVMSDHSTHRNNGYPAYVGAQYGGGHVANGPIGSSHVGGSGHDLSVSPGQHIGHPSDNMSTVVNQFRSLALPAGPGLSQAGGNLGHGSLHHSYAAQEQPVAFQPFHMPIPVGMPSESTFPVGLSGIPYAPHVAGLHPMVQYQTQAMPYTPGRIPSYGDRGNSEVPGLENRRGSYSTTDSAPATPFFGSGNDRNASRIAVVRSAFNTPSPEQVMAAGVPPKAPQTVEDSIIQLVSESPEIPRAVPAVFTPPTHTKTLDQCLENRISGNRNVYIRGLHPTTDDELLLKYAERFGEVEQSKAIIDTSTGACKGFGFAKFYDVRNSEKCIKGFFHLGYEVGFARESFNARLKAEGDEASTNLYLSNLPKNLTEPELNAIFAGYHVVSSKILRDSMGNSRGVGFARFSTREECEDIIRKYHGIAVGNGGQLMNVRYADTPAQKELKRVTAERRQFRTNEYNIGAYGTADVGMAPSIYNHWGRRSGVGSKGSYTAQGPQISMNPTIGRGTPGETGHTYTQSNPATGHPSSDDGTADEGVSVTIVDSPAMKNGSTQSSPTVKKEKP